MPGGEDAERLAIAWRAAIARTTVTSINRRALRPLVESLAEDVLRAADRQDSSGMFQAGARLVEAHFTEVETLQRTLAVLGEELTELRPQARLGALLGGLAAGFAHALRERTRGEQEEITAAAFAASAEAEQARWESEARLHAMFEGAVIGMSVIDVSGRPIDVNRSMYEMFGFSAADFMQQNLWDHAHPDDDAAGWAQVSEILTGEREHLRIVRLAHRQDGSTFWVDTVLSLIRDLAGEPLYVVAMLQDVTEQYEMQNRLQHLAYHDPLTGISNRTLFFERLDAALAAEPARVGLCYLDLDGFKTVNDTLGHDQGDLLLRTVAVRLDEALGPAGHLVARTGGDEFVILVDGITGREQMRAVAQTALEIIRRPVQLSVREVTISASAGVVRGGDGGDDTAALMKAADTTMYDAKRAGRDRIALFDPQRHREDIVRSDLIARMPTALAQHEFTVEYQPLVDLADGRMIGVEALARWDPPTGPRISPGQFIGLAEETGLIVGLGRYVLRRACEDATRWRAADAEVTPLVSVNLAARQLREPTLVSEVAKILADTEWPAERLQLELTESDAMGTTPETIATLRGLADMGIRIAIDDFGTGYSNLAYLGRLPVHTLKLAGPFVSGGEASSGVIESADAKVVRAVVRLAHSLGMSVIAEAVETAAQHHTLLELACDFGQGFRFSPSVPADRVPAMWQTPPWPPR